MVPMCSSPRRTSIPPASRSTLKAPGPLTSRLLQTLSREGERSGVHRRLNGVGRTVLLMASGHGPTSNQTFLPDPSSGSTPQDVARVSTKIKPNHAASQDPA
jgi:hypothetical protein